MFVMKSKLYFTLLFSIVSISLSAQSFVEDIDGNQYVTTTIGTQTWMAQNLRVTKYNNGDPIPNVQDAASWSAQNIGAWSHYNNDSVYDYDLGKLYKFYTTEDARGLCPDGWRMPTREDWEELRDYLGGEEIAASGLKATGGAYYWTEPMVGDNTYGFNGAGGGVRTESGSYNSLGTRGIWWTSTKGNTGSIAVAMYNDSNELKIIGILRGDGASVRCIQSNQDSRENPNYNNGGVPQEGLELYFEFDGNLDDDSPNGITLQQVVSDPASMYTDDKNGGVMSALTLNNDQDYLFYDAAFDESKLSTSFTISMWAKVNTTYSYTNFSLFEIGNQRLGNNNSGIELKLGENYLDNCPGETYRIMFNIMGNGNAVWVNCESYATLNQWNQYTIVFETGIAKLYINGELIGINYDSVTEVEFANNDFYILSKDNAGTIPSRSIDKLGVWSRAFSPEEVKGLYHSVNYNQVSWNSVETVTHGFNSSFTEAFANNNTDKVYKLKVSGTYGIANGTPHRDAAYNINNENLITGCDSNWQLDGQCPPPPPTAPEHYSDNHEYEYFMGFGTTVGSEVSFVDGNYNDNAGSLTFELFEGTIINIQEPEGIPYYVPTVELTAFYNFDGTADDESIFANHGTVNGPAPTEDRFGTFSSAYYFDGVDDYIQVPNAEGNQINGDYSISFWYNPGEGYGSGNNFGSYNHIIGKWGSSDASFVVSVQTDGMLAYGNYDHSQPSAQRGKTIFSPNSLNVDEWVHIALTLQGQEMKMYINGTEVAGRLDGVVPQLSNKQLDIGFESGERGFIKGSLDELGIWKRALTADEISMLYNPYSTSKLSNRTMIFSDVYSKEGVKFAQTISFDTLTYADSLVGFQFQLPLDPSIIADSIYYASSQDLNIEASFIDNAVNVAVSSSQFITSYESVLDIFYTPYMSGVYEMAPNSVKLNNAYTNNIQSGTLTIDPFMYGDVDENGDVDNYDAGIILHHTVGSELLPMDNLRWWEFGPWFDWRTKAADVDEDGQILAMDAVYILQYIVGLVTDFPVITTPVENVTVELTDTGLLFTAPEEINGFNISLPEIDGVEYLEPTILWDNVSSVVRDENGMGVAIATSTAQKGVMLEIPLKVTSAENVDIIMTAFSNNSEAQLKVVVNSSMVNNETSTGLPQQYTLSQNYPNPFNPSTQIEYALPKATQVTLEVFNSVGQKVMELVNGQQSAGYHTATFDATGLSSGVYLYKLTTPSFTQTKKMLLIK
jgi:uncharacterized protein (TIGR02145 family)